MNILKLKNEKQFSLMGDVEQTTRDGRTWFLRFEILGSYTPEELANNFIKENILLMKVLNEENQEVLILENYDTIISMQIYSHVSNMDESYVSIQMKKETFN